MLIIKYTGRLYDTQALISYVMIAVKTISGSPYEWTSNDIKDICFVKLDKSVYQIDLSKI